MRENELPFQMKCPNCGKEMERGYVTLISAYASSLYFSREQIPWVFVGGKDKDLIMGNSAVLTLKKNYRREGFRCKNCELVVIDRKEA